MGRKPSINLNLPKGVRARKRGAKIWYYLDTGGKPRKEIPLGNDYAMAIKKWAELEIDATPSHAAIITFRYVAERYTKKVIPTKAPSTQKGNLRELVWLYKFFDNPPAPLEKIEPINIRQYLDWRGNIRGKREKALFSHIWNWSREQGYTNLPNPCAGIKGISEKGRKYIYIEDSVFNAVYEKASQPLRDAMDMAYLTGQRPADVLKMTDHDIGVDNTLSVTQNKTKARLRISIEGELAILIKRILTRKANHKVRSFSLIVDDKGQRLTACALRGHFDRAREAAGINKESFQFRDLRAKAGTDKAESSGDIRQAQKQLGHSTITMTEHYVRDRKGSKVTPTK
ncbi:tyrosine-type recombinase/integrase [Nitrosomonas oligotropha]|uniref:Site-specific recombinase XerC n=1 Tax=Nitrosomonas oligotropha TaxID=42354 RepID=A0A1H8QMQ2_9PROT|nr:tyrosine-type recombinase/integrase [Nitrosomonas oligotropha]SDW86980.1 Site-specific recombinase XerC [Nitrosomonas oligotropha]SEO55525.1 Site-specific recombinase XerC [Nitrosomonas oligotropha]